MKPVIPGHQHNPLTGILLTLVSMSLFACQDALIKYLTADYPLLQILFIRSIVVIIPLACVLYLRFGARGFHTSRALDHAKRVLFNLLAFLSFYYSLTRIDLGQAVAIAMSAPLITTTLSGPLLGERANTLQKTIVLIGFFGVLLVIQPLSGAFDWIGTASVLFGALMFSLLVIQTRKMIQTESTELMVFLAALTFFCLTALFMPILWVPPVGLDWLLLMGAGFVTLFAQLCIVHAYRFAPVYILAPFEYVTIPWALLLGWLIFAEIPTAIMLAGAGIIIACGIAIIEAERRAARTG